MSNHRETPRSARVALLRPRGRAADSEHRLLQAAHLTPVRLQDTEYGNTAEWASVDPDIDATLTIEQMSSNEDLACASFTGADRVALATRLVPVLSYMPIELMHLSARASPVSEERQAALSTLGQFYATDEGVAHWDTDIQRTIEIAWEDPAAEVRLEAAIAELRGNPVSARAHIEQALRAEPNAAIQVALSGLCRIAELESGGSAGIAQTRPGTLRFAEDRLALPIYRVGTTEDVVRHFSDSADVTTRRHVSGAETIATVVELTAHELDATITYVTTDSWEVGCTYFSGSERVVVAIGTAHVLKYFPINLAKTALSDGRYSELRTMALRALTFAASRRMFPGSEIDPEIVAIIAGSLDDPDPTVRFAALSANVLLRGEIAAERPDADKED